MSDLAEFLTARLDADETKAKQAAVSNWFELPRLDHPAVVSPGRQMWEVEAKRAILAEHRPDPLAPEWCETCEVRYPCPTVCLVVSVWADHPDYDPAWAVTS